MTGEVEEVWRKEGGRGGKRRTGKKTECEEASAAASLTNRRKKDLLTKIKTKTEEENFQGEI